jgi:hypothetical protein
MIKFNVINLLDKQSGESLNNGFKVSFENEMKPVHKKNINKYKYCLIYNDVTYNCYNQVELTQILKCSLAKINRIIKFPYKYENIKIKIL